MWTGGKPPRTPQSGTSPKPETDCGPPSRTPRLFSEPYRPTGVNAELEALKQRGLAKILNKHFTETAQKLAEEKAAADAALADLEQRKANTSEFHVSTNGELSPLDSLYVSVNNWRNECRKKERETLLLYQRYVNKYGSTGQVRSPGDALLFPHHAAGAGGTSTSNKEARSWIINDDGSVSGIPAPAAPSAAPPSQLVPTMAAEIERTLEEYIQKGALRLPSAEFMGIEETFQTVQEKQVAEFRNFYRKQLQKRGIDARSPQRTSARKEAYLGPGWVDVMGRRFASKSASQTMMMNDGVPNDCRIGIVPRERRSGQKEDDSDDEDREDDDYDNDDDFEYNPDLPIDTSGGILNTSGDDDCSVVSGLTSIHSQITRSVIHDCERTVYEFLTEERNSIQKIMAEEEAKAAADAVRTENNVQAANVKTEEAENMVKQMEDILHEYQVKNAADEKSAPCVVQHEARRHHTNNTDEHWMVYYDEFYQQEYYHELNSNRTQWEPPGKDGNNESGEGGVKDASSTSISENTAAASASGHQCGDNASVSSSHHAAVLLSSEDVMPDRQGSGLFSAHKSGRRASYESRIAQFRRKRKRERRRKIIASVFITIAAVVASVRYYTKYYQPSSLSLQNVDNVVQISPKVVDEAPTSITASETFEIIQQAAGEVASRMIFSFEKEIIAKALGIEPVDGLAACDHSDSQEQVKGEKGLEHRPWGCNIPFAYLFHRRCNTLAKQQPLFDLQALILSMLQ